MRLRVVAALAAAVLAACASRPAPSTFASRDRDGIVAVLRSQEQAWNRGDLDGFMAGYARSPDLVFTSGGRIRRGWDETYAKYRERYGAARETMGHLTFEVIEVQPVGADGAIVLGRWSLSSTPNAGRGVFTVVLERQRDGWRIVHDHTSSDA